MGAAGKKVPYSTYDKLGAIDQGAIVENKRLGYALRISGLRQAERDSRYHAGPCCSKPNGEINRSTDASTSRTTALRQASSVRCKHLVVGHHEIPVESETVRLGGEHLIAATAARA